MPMSRSSVQPCPTCGGLGLIVAQRQAGHTCPTCHGVGEAVSWAGQWWSWQHPLTELSILERHLEHTVSGLVSALLFLFLLLGLLFGGRQLIDAIANGEVWSTLLSASGAMAMWWFGLLSGMFLLFRLERDATMRPVIPVRSDGVPAAGDPWTAKTMDIGRVVNELGLRVLEHAWREAKASQRQYITPLHLLFALSSTPDVGSMLIRMGVTPQDLRQRIAHLLARESAGATTPMMNTGVRTAVSTAFALAAEDGRRLITPPYLLAGLIQLDDPARELLFDMGIDSQKLDHMIRWLLINENLRRRVREFISRAATKPRGAIDRGYTAVATPMLNRFSRDLTALARDNRLPYVVGREHEVDETLRIMTSGRSVILVGDPGVGVTQILSALAERMAAEDVPENMQDKRLVELSAAAVVAGAGGIGQIEQRVQTIVNEITRAGNIILAIDHVDHLAGVSSSGSGGLDAAQIIAQAITQRQFQSVATATVGDYRRVVERGSLLSAFEKVEVNEMEPDQALEVLEARLGGLEAKYRVYFTFDALDKAVSLSHRYIHDRPLPGKAIELLEESAVLTKKQFGPNALVTGQIVAGVVTERTKIAVSDVTSGEQEKLLHLEEELHKRVIGQDEAVKAVANALRRARAELRDTRRPIANLLFLGPTGVGKTELAKTVSAVFFGSEENMIRLDMSEYQEVSSVSRLIGAPAGYAGADSGGVLTEAVRHQPYTVVLLDELEKAHPDILNLFLQVMDDGRLTDASGRTVDFTNVIVIATSNAGTQFIQDQLKQGVRIETMKEQLVSGALTQYFRPEFLNRFDSIVIFSPLGPLEVVKITNLMVQQIAERLAPKGITLRASPEAVAELASRGFDPLFGARPLRRIVQEQVDNALAQYLLQGKLGRRDVAILEPGGTIRVEHPAPV